MHAVRVGVEIDKERVEQARQLLNDFGVPTAKQLPGFVSGTWCLSTDGSHGESLVIFESEEAAAGGASRFAQGPPPDAPVKFVSAEVYEVLATV